MPRISISIALAFTALLMLFNPTYLPGQDIEEEPWSTSIYFNPSVMTSTSDWSMSHPYYSPDGSADWETITGTFEQQLSWNGGLEMKKGYFGYQCNFEYMPQKLAKSVPITDHELNLLIGDISILYYPPINDSESFKPYLALGGGLIKASGDIDNSGLIISYGAGVKISISPNLGINFGLKGTRIKYTQLEVAENITKDISISPFKILIGIFYQL
ncbi:outer membrane beta-barrel protein [Candidatus Neomarinimicrobiota bacterium]